MEEIERKKQKEKEQEEKNKEELIKAYQELKQKRNQNKNKTYNKSKTVNKTIKSVNKYHKLIPKKSNNKLATKANHESYKGFSFYNSSMKSSNKNLSQSQPKIKPKNIYK